jgi:hypothetical protein
MPPAGFEPATYGLEVLGYLALGKGLSPSVGHRLVITFTDFHNYTHAPVPSQNTEPLMDFVLLIP